MRVRGFLKGCTLSGGTATGAASAWRWTTVWPGRAAPR
ncbi:twin-arginine translocation signal domain-containing protein [Acidovorax sp. JHL-9]